MKDMTDNCGYYEHNLVYKLSIITGRIIRLKITLSKYRMNQLLNLSLTFHNFCRPIRRLKHEKGTNLLMMKSGKEMKQLIHTVTIVELCCYFRLDISGYTFGDRVCINSSLSFKTCISNPS